MGLLDSWATYRSFWRNKTLKDWVIEQYPGKLLEELAQANLQSIHRPWVLQQDYSQSQWMERDQSINVMSEKLFKRYGNEILAVLVRPFYRANDPEYYERRPDPDYPDIYLNRIECIGKLPGAVEVCDRRSLMEFLVRNALALTARDIIDGIPGAAWKQVPPVTVYRFDDSRKVT